MIRYLKRTNKKEDLKEIYTITDDCWIKCVDPDEDDLQALAKKFNLDLELLMDGLDIYENPRIEQEGGSIYIYLRTPVSENALHPKIEQEPTESFLLILTKDNIITISKSDLEIFKMLENSKNLMTNDRSLTTLLILSYISKMFGNSVRDIMKTVKKDRANITSYNEKELFKLVIKEDTINDYLSSFSPLIDINAQIIGIKALRFPEEEKEFIEDLAIDLYQTLNSCKSALKNITTMRSYHTTNLTNNLNRTVTILTILTVFLTIPTIIFSLYGMNIALPFQKHPFALEIIFGIVAIGGVILVILLKKLKMM